jgi:hypothetical protein
MTTEYNRKGRKGRRKELSRQKAASSWQQAVEKVQDSTNPKQWQLQQQLQSQLHRQLNV